MILGFGRTVRSLCSNLPRSLYLMVISTPLKNMKVSWDDYSQYMEKKKNVPNHQPDYLFINIYHIYINISWWKSPPSRWWKPFSSHSCHSSWVQGGGRTGLQQLLQQLVCFQVLSPSIALGKTWGKHAIFIHFFCRCISWFRELTLNSLNIMK